MNGQIPPSAAVPQAPREPGESQADARAAQFVRFLFVGAFAAALNFCSRIALSRWLPYASAIIVAYLIGLVVAFLLNRRLVFTGATGRLHHQMFWFVAVNALGLTLTLVVSLVFAHYVLPFFHVTWHAEEVAHAFGVATPILTSYLGHKHLSFK